MVLADSFANHGHREKTEPQLMYLQCMAVVRFEGYVSRLRKVAIVDRRSRPGRDQN